MAQTECDDQVCRVYISRSTIPLRITASEIMKFWNIVIAKCANPRKWQLIDFGMINIDRVLNSDECTIPNTVQIQMDSNRTVIRICKARILKANFPFRLVAIRWMHAYCVNIVVCYNVFFSLIISLFCRNSMRLFKTDSYTYLFLYLIIVCWM